MASTLRKDVKDKLLQQMSIIRTKTINISHRKEENDDDDDELDEEYIDEADESDDGDIAHNSRRRAMSDSSNESLEQAKAARDQHC